MFCCYFFFHASLFKLISSIWTVVIPWCRSTIHTSNVSFTTYLNLVKLGMNVTCMKLLEFVQRTRIYAELLLPRILKGKKKLKTYSTSFSLTFDVVKTFLLPGPGDSHWVVVHKIHKKIFQKIVFFKTTSPIYLVFGLWHYLVGLYQVCSNYLPGANTGPARGYKFLIEIYNEIGKKSSVNHKP